MECQRGIFHSLMVSGQAITCIVIYVCACVWVYVFVHQQSKHLLKPLTCLLPWTVRGPALMWRVKAMSCVLWVLQASQSDWNTHLRPWHRKGDVSLSWNKTITLPSGLVLLGILWPDTYTFKWERPQCQVYYWSSCKWIKARLHLIYNLASEIQLAVVIGIPFQVTCLSNALSYTGPNVFVDLKSQYNQNKNMESSEDLENASMSTSE